MVKKKKYLRIRTNLISYKMTAENTIEFIPRYVCSTIPNTMQKYFYFITQKTNHLFLRNSQFLNKTT